MIDPEMIREGGNEEPKPDETIEEASAGNGEEAAVQDTEPKEACEEKQTGGEGGIPNEELAVPHEPANEPGPQEPEPGTYAWFQVEKYKKAVQNRDAMAEMLGGRSLKIYAILESVKLGWTLLLSFLGMILFPILMLTAASGQSENLEIQFNSSFDLFAVVDLILIWLLVSHLNRLGGKNLAADIRGLRIMRMIHLISGGIGMLLVILVMGILAMASVWASAQLHDLVAQAGPGLGDLLAGAVGLIPVLLAIVSISMILEWIYQLCLYRYLGDSIAFLQGNDVSAKAGYLRFWQIMRVAGQVAAIVLEFVLVGSMLMIRNQPGVTGIGQPVSVVILAVSVLFTVFGSTLEIALCILRFRLFGRAVSKINNG